jgi:hypothetical protein
MTEQFQFALDPAAALDTLINRVLWAKSDVPVPDKVRELLLILQWHKGLDHAKPLGEIAEKLQVNAREVKQLAKTLTETFGLPVGASRQEPYGYFLCVTTEDYRAALSPYINEIRSLVRRCNALQPSERLNEILGQLQLELGDERKAG